MKNTILFILFSAFVTLSYGQKSRALPQLKADVAFLSSDAMKGRLTGSIFQDIAAEYIASRFMEIGVLPKGDPGSYFQTFYYSPVADPHSSTPTQVVTEDSLKIINVCAFINNNAKHPLIIQNK